MKVLLLRLWVRARMWVLRASCLHRGHALRWHVDQLGSYVWCKRCGWSRAAELPPAAEQARRMVRAELQRSEREALENVWRARGGVTPGDLARFRAYLGSLDALAGGKRP